jgi:N-acyl homoserine lactone hydrolase
VADTVVKRLFIFLCGFEIVPQGLSLKGAGGRVLLAEPICAYLVETTEGWVLLDTGLDANRLTDPVLLHRYYTGRGWSVPPLVRPDHSLVAQMAEVGVTPADVGRVVLSHAHADHTGHLRLFRHAPIYVQGAELDQAFAQPDELGWIGDDYNDPALKWVRLSGDHVVVPGLELISTPGHTAGHQSARVTLPSGRRLVLTFDAGDLRANFDDDILPGSCFDEALAARSLARLRALAAEPRSELVLFHDPQALGTLKLSPQWYD